MFRAEELRRLEEIHERVVAEGSITDEIECPRCRSTDASYVGGDMSGLGEYYDMYVCEGCGRQEGGGVRVFLVPVSKEDFHTHPSMRGLPLEERIPKCHIHGTRMSPAMWENETTYYVCGECQKERVPGGPVNVVQGPEIPRPKWED